MTNEELVKENRRLREQLVKEKKKSQKIINLVKIMSLLINLMIKTNKSIMEPTAKDDLTTLYTKESFKNKALKRVYDNSNHYLAFIDIDNFKGINDFYGHLIGDEALKLLSSTLSSTFRSNDLCARFGGDEFVLLLNGIDFETLRVLMKRLKENLERKFIEEPNLPHFTLSIGVTKYNNYLDYKSNIDIADKAMYIGKNAGKNTAIYLGSMNEAPICLLEKEKTVKI
ncbi:MAG: GGDEF domain-containing protein [Bacilli bacterium]|nr:GGDEF domain-containing protein [Bacilli bacterium]